jgi:hypothetical protein
MTTSRYLIRAINVVTGMAALAATAGIGPRGFDVLVSPANAVIGRPLTPLSYAGVARRTTYRAAAYGSYYGAASAARAATNATVVYPPATVVYAPIPEGCVKIIDSRGTVTYRCP